MSNEAVIVATARTPIGRAQKGSLVTCRPDDLAALVCKEVVARTGVDPARIDEVIFGCANQAGEDNRNVARMALLLAGLPQTVPGFTVNRLCASGLEAVNQAARAIRWTAGDECRQCQRDDKPAGMAFFCLAAKPAKHKILHHEVGVSRIIARSRRNKHEISFPNCHDPHRFCIDSFRHLPCGRFLLLHQ